MMGIRVLLVDDDPMVLQVNRGCVEAEPGFAVVGTARNGREALEAAASLAPDLVLLDVFMPDKDGLSMLRELRSRAIPADVILVTAADDAATVQEALRGGAFDVVIKPFRFERLHSALEAYRAVKDGLRGAEKVSQEQLDRMLRPAALPGESPKGVNEITLNQVVRFLSQRREPATSADVAEGLGIARVTARRYLEYLEGLGKVRVEMQYGGLGRPLNRYTLV
jgi:two-component system, CitB family, response regulator DctR